MTRFQRRMLKIDALMAHAAACERNMTIYVHVDSRKLAEAITFRLMRQQARR